MVEALSAAGITLANEAATGEIVGALAERNLRGIVLKGPSIRRWLYEDTAERPSMDVDLLASWQELDAVERVLESLDWRYVGIDAVGPGRPHCRIWERRGSGLELELHRSIAGIGVSPEDAWRVLSAETEPMVIRGARAQVLSEPARAMHVALHAAQHGAGFTRTLTDLELALEKLSTDVWDAAAELAVRLDAVPAFVAGLGLVPAGEDLVTRLQLSGGLSTDIALRAASPPPGAEGLDWFMQLPGLRARARFLFQHLAPPPGYMRVWSRLARRGPVGLAGAYVWRPVWLALHLPGAYRAHRRARRDTH